MVPGPLTFTSPLFPLSKNYLFSSFFLSKSINYKESEYPIIQSIFT